MYKRFFIVPFAAVVSFASPAFSNVTAENFTDIRRSEYDTSFAPSASIEPEHNIVGFMDFSASQNTEENSTDIYFSANEIENNKELNTITARGDVNIVRNNITIKADKIIYNQRDDIITAVGNVVILEESGNVVFSDYVVLTDKMTQGEMNNIKMILKDKTRIAARTAKRLENDDKVMRDVVYSPCDVCKNEDPLWQLKARKITHDAEEKNLYYKDATLEIKGVPVLYTPFLSHPDPTVKRRSGFLPPTLSSNSYLGAAIQPRYFYSISDHEDLTLSPILSSDKGVVLDGAYRKYFYQGKLFAEGSIMRDDDTDRNRGHLFLDGRYEVNDYWVASTSINYASSGSYLKDLDLRNREDMWLVSNAKLQGFDNRNYASVETYYYKLISSDVNIKDKPYVIPLMTYENIGDPGAYGMYNKTQLDFASIYREDEPSSQRGTMINSWVLPYTSPYGEKYTMQASVKSDLYYVDKYSYDINSDDSFTGTTGRIFPQLAMEWKLPFVKATENTRQILEPTVIGVLAPSGGNKISKIPNEDSLYKELSDTNILDINRYAGYDRNDTGSRVSYGLNWSSYGDRFGRTSAMLAQSYNFQQEDDAFPINNDPDSRFSDYVGRVYASPHDYLDLNYRFRADKDNLELRYSELSAAVGPPILNAYVGYIYLQADRDNIIQGYSERKELYTALSSQLTRDWSISVYNIQDLTYKGGSLEYGGSLTYEDECLKLITNIRRNNSSDPDFKGDFEFSVTFLLKTLGGFSSK